MLRAELAGEPYSKADHNRALQPLLDGRSKSSIEFKHQNISAVLVGMGLPYIDGYKPARNYQKAILPQAIEDYLIRHPEFFDSLADGAILNPIVAPTIGDRPVEAIFEDRPDRIIVPSGDEKPWLSRRGKKIDFARRDAMNRHLGQLGEEFAVEIEKRRLLSFGRDDLAAKVEWVAETCGDGVGFDVLSFDESDDVRAVHRGQDDGPGQALPVLCHGERGPLLRGLPGTVPALPGLRLRQEPQDLRVVGGLSTGVPAGAGRVSGVDLSGNPQIMPGLGGFRKIIRPVWGVE